MEIKRKRGKSKAGIVLKRGSATFTIQVGEHITFFAPPFHNGGTSKRPLHVFIISQIFFVIIIQYNLFFTGPVTQIQLQNHLWKQHFITAESSLSFRVAVC